VSEPDPEDLEWCEYHCGDAEYHDKDCPIAKLTRGSWCTPKWLADLVGPVAVDPCTNARSHVQAMMKCVLENGDTGLHDTAVAGTLRWQGKPFKLNARDTTFFNPPYGHGEVLPWVKHYRHTTFIYLLRWDPSTDWFSELIPHCSDVWFPSQRINFEPPPRIKASTNPFPHALYLRTPSSALLDRLRGAGHLLTVDKVGTLAQSARHEPKRDDRSDGESAGGRGAAEVAGAGGECFCSHLYALTYGCGGSCRKAT
jgi:hypothetical protein